MSQEQIVEVVIEIPRGSANKYEFDKERGRFVLDRVLYSPMFYPAEYGYIEETLAEDGDPLDALVLTTYPTFPGVVIESRVVGYLRMADEKGEDEKLLAVATGDPRMDHIRDLSDVPPHILKEIAHFFEVYKTLENKKTEVRGWENAEAAVRLLEDARRRYRERG
ncbi:inorganic diphosphatase [Brockia lithotrophica]|uniref:Inorganic pyrophosphatase n=1 Tax=Brockia lithotrophica TaxID=933949 RepID=A0A660L5R9_9BACL|nr:inorganic diphosphatase [Brockia lithotrophica]RKQ88685.1 inorganic pyrophosphatase [Brockia lithotrophica]